MHKTSLLGEILKHVVLAIFGVVILLPFVQMLSYSIMPENEIHLSGFHLWPNRFDGWENYSHAFETGNLLTYMKNGVIVTVLIFFFQVIIALPCAYAISKLKWWGRDVVFALVLLCLLIPPHAVAIPVYLLLWQIGALDTYASLIIPFTISVFGIFLMRQFFMTVPDDLVDAARMDGISELGIVWRVMLPTAVPALVAFGIFSVIAHWNDYFWPLLVLSSEELYTPPLGVTSFRNDEWGSNYGALMAAATIIIAPLVLAFLLAQRRFIEGITLSGMK